MAQSPLEVWRAWAEDVREVALDCGHFVAEGQPEPCAVALQQFFST
jgi:haloacetate dehalogenase